MKAMKTKKIIAASIAGLFLLSGAAADDFDFENEDFSFGDSGDSSSSSPVEISGTVSTDARFYVNDENTDNLGEVPLSGGAATGLSVKYSSSNADAEIKFNLNETTLKENQKDIIDEAFITSYIGNFKLEAGKMKNVWGKGDKLHVIDNFNADDYSDFIIPDYLDRRVGTPMVKGSYSFDYSGNLLSNLKIEAVYTPFLPVDRFKTEGRWMPSQVASLTGAVRESAKEKLSVIISNLEQTRMEVTPVLTLAVKAQAGDSSAQSQLATLAGGAANIPAYVEQQKAVLAEANAAYTYALNNASALENDASILYPNTDMLKYSQAGARFTGSIGAFDFGASYYFGHFKQPSVNATKMDSYIEKYLGNEAITESDKFLSYDRKQTFGLEAATILWHFNVRGEACLNLTEDTSGDDPWVHNNSIQWLGGFDIDLPFWNMNVNIQETGTYVLGNDKIKESATELLDVDYSANGYSNNKIAANITTSFANEKIAPEVTVMYGIENGDLVVLPKLIYKPSSELSLTASGMYIHSRNDDSEFAAWKNNSFIQLGASLSF